MIAEFTHPDVMTRGVAEGWAEPIEDPTTIDWHERQAAAWLPFEVVDGMPVCPGPGPFPVDRGRNRLGTWGELKAVDTYVIVNHRDENHLLLVDRDGEADDPDLGLALPGGAVDPGESAEEAAVRELFEETGLLLSRVGPSAHNDLSYFGHVGPTQWVNDPRGSRQAWVVTRVHYRFLGRVHALPEVKPQPGEVKSVAWWPVEDIPYERVWSAHRPLIFAAEHR